MRASLLGAPRRGFTMIEVLAVLLILSVLVGILVTSLGRAEDVTLEHLTRARLDEISLAIVQWEHERGDWPPSVFAADAELAVNELNAGAEALVAALWSDGFEGGGLSEELLVNADGDRSKKTVTDFETRELFELADAWENPIAYFHHASYSEAQLYRTLDPETGEPVDSWARARENAATGRFHEPTGFQLLSAGLDGRFGTPDDVGSFAP